MLKKIRSTLLKNLSKVSRIGSVILLLLLVLLANNLFSSFTSQLDQQPLHQSSNPQPTSSVPRNNDEYKWESYRDPNGRFEFEYPKDAVILVEDVDPTVYGRALRYITLSLQTGESSWLNMYASVERRPSTTSVDRLLVGSLENVIAEERNLPIHIRHAVELQAHSQMFDSVKAFPLADGSIVLRMISSKWIYELGLARNAFGNSETIELFSEVAQTFEAFE